MKFQIPCGVLAKAVAQVRSAASPTDTIPILANVLVEIDDKRLRLTANNTSLQVQSYVDCQAQEQGAVTVPAQRLHDALRNLPAAMDATLRLDVETNRLVIQAGRSRFALPCLPAEDYPVMKTDQGMVSAELDSEEFTRLIDKTAFAIANDKVRQFLNGVFLHVAKEDGQAWLRAVSTDGHRMAVAEMEAPEDLELSGVIVPESTVTEVRRQIDAAGEKITVLFSPSKIAFMVGETLIISKLIGGHYINYQAILPPVQPNTLKVENGLLSAALKRAMVISTDKSRSVRLEFNPGVVKLQARDENAALVEDELDADLAGEPIGLRFNASYVLDMTSLIEGEEIVFSYGQAAEPVLVTDPADRHARFVLMPQFGS